MKKFSLLMILSCLYFTNTNGQDIPLMDFHFEKDSIFVEQGQTFTNFLILENLDKEPVLIEELIPHEMYPGLLLFPEPNFILSAGERKRFPIKFVANLAFLKRENQSISFSLKFQNKEEKVSRSASFTTSRIEDKNISFFQSAAVNYIDPNAPESKISFFIENRSFSKRSVKISLKVTPDGLEILPKEITATLQGKEKQLIEFNISFRRQRHSFPDYLIDVKIEDLVTFENVGTSTLKIAVLANSRQMMPNSSSLSNQNTMEVLYNQSSRNFNYLQLKGNTDFNLGNQVQGRFNSAADFYLNQNAFNVFDTWLELERKNASLRIGNIYGEDYDYSTSGRGAKAKWQINKKNGLEVFALDNNYNLFSNFFQEIEGSKVFGTKYEFGKNQYEKAKVSYLFEDNPRLAIKTHLIHFNAPFVLDSIHHFKTEIGLSSENGVINNDQEFGAALSLNYQVRIQKWEINSFNSISSPYYAGQKRGSYLFNQNLNYQLTKRIRTFLNYQNTKVEPKYLRYQNAPGYPVFPFNIPDYSYQQQSVQSGVQYGQNSWHLLLAPSVVHQKNLQDTLKNDLLSYRLKSELGTTFRKHGLNISLEYSYSKSDSRPDWFNGLRTNFSYRYQRFNLNALLQYNPNDVSDFNRYNNFDHYFINYSIYSSYSFEALNKDLTGNISAGINYSELYRNINQNFTAAIEYKISPTWAGTGYLNYAHYKTTGNYQYEGNNSQFRIGVKKYFVRATTKGNHKVNLQLFEDKNGNGILDQNEEVLAGEPVQLNDFIAITDKKGKVSFQNVPTGTYNLKVRENAGLRLMMEPNLLINRNENIQVGLIINKKVSGSLQEIKQEYDFQETDVTGVLIYVKDEEGHIKSTVVDQNNYFEFYLKNGIYEIFIENNKYQYIHPSRKIIIEDGKEIEPIIFEYKKKNKEIKIKRF